MRTKLFVSISLFVLLATVPAAIASSGGPTVIDWKNYDAAKEEGAKQDKKYFVYFSSKNCGYCRKLENNTFKNKDIVEYLNTNFVSIHVPVDKNRNIAMRHKVQGVPDIQLLAGNGDVIGRWVGYTDPDHLLKILKFFKTDSYQKMGFKEFVQQP